MLDRDEQVTPGILNVFSEIGDSQPCVPSHAKTQNFAVLLLRIGERARQNQEQPNVSIGLDIDALNNGKCLDALCRNIKTAVKLPVETAPTVDIPAAIGILELCEDRLCICEV